MSLTQPIHKGLRERPTAIAAICGDGRIGRAILAHCVARLAGAFREAGVGPGDRVGLLMRHGIRYPGAGFAVWWAGGAVNPVNIRRSAAEVACSLDSAAGKRQKFQLREPYWAGKSRRIDQARESLSFMPAHHAKAPLLGHAREPLTL